MRKRFNVAGACMPDRHYMVNIDSRMEEIKGLVEAGDYLTIHKARQYGKTTTLLALEQYLKKDYYVVFLDFQMLGSGEFKDENTFALSFTRLFLRAFQKNEGPFPERCAQVLEELSQAVREEWGNFRLQRLFECLSDLCGTAKRPVVLMADEVDSAADHQIFLDFLSQLRAYYIRRATEPTFYSVILAGVYDIKNLKQKFRPEHSHRQNSPWNIASDFLVDMSLPQKGIFNMLEEYEADCHTGMDKEEMARLLYHYTSGYPFLVSRLCKLLDEEISRQDGFASKGAAWTKEGFLAAVRIMLSEKNSLFESLMGKLLDYPQLNEMLQALLFVGRGIVYSPDELAMDMASMFGFIQNQDGNAVIANRIFEMRLYNHYLSAAELQGQQIYKASLENKSQFIVNGYLDMRRVLEKFVEHFDDLFHDSGETFVEEAGRKYFLLYLRPIINGSGNYYVESRTRSLGRTDVIVAFHGVQYIIEMKIWRGNEYNERGEQQLLGYLEDYHTDMGYLLSFNFNKKKNIGVHEIMIGDKRLVEAVV